MPNRIKWTIVHYKPPEAMTLNGDGVGGVKVKLMAKVTPKDDGSVVSFNVHLGGPALFGPIGMVVAAALRTRYPPIAAELRHGVHRARSGHERAPWPVADRLEDLLRTTVGLSGIAPIALAPRRTRPGAGLRDW